MNDTDDTDDTAQLRELVRQALEKCTDASLLDLLYKLLICESDHPVVGKT
jgi:hypothetical protein